MKRNNEDYEKRQQMLAIENEYGNSMPDRIKSTKPERTAAQKVDDYHPHDEETQQISEYNRDFQEGAPDATYDSIQTRN